MLLPMPDGLSKPMTTSTPYSDFVNPLTAIHVSQCPYAVGTKWWKQWQESFLYGQIHPKTDLKEQIYWANHMRVTIDRETMEAQAIAPHNSRTDWTSHTLAEVDEAAALFTVLPNWAPEYYESEERAFRWNEDDKRYIAHLMTMQTQKALKELTVVFEKVTEVVIGAWSSLHELCRVMRSPSDFGGVKPWQNWEDAPYRAPSRDTLRRKPAQHTSKRRR